MNMKRFIVVPVVFALGWFSFGIGSALSRVNQKVMSRNAVISKTLNLGPAKSGDRWYFIVTCTDQCKDTSVTAKDISGNPDLYVAIGKKLPLLSFRTGCKDCLCVAFEARKYNKCNFKNLNSNSFGVLVHAYTYVMNTTLKIESRNLDGIKVIPIHSKSWDSLKKGEIRNFKATCNGRCKDLNVWVRGTSPKTPQGGLVTFASQIPYLCLAYDLSNVIGTRRYCRDYICRRRGDDIANSCQFKRLTKDSFVVSVVSPERDMEGVKVSVVGPNVKGFEPM